MRTAEVEATEPRCDTLPRDAWRTNHVWSVARQAALARDGFTCQTCSVTDWDATLHVHHVSPVTDGYGPGCAHHLDGLIVLCPQCHADVHRWLRAPEGTQLALAV